MHPTLPLQPPLPTCSMLNLYPGKSYDEAVIALRNAFDQTSDVYSLSSFFIELINDEFASEEDLQKIIRATDGHIKKNLNDEWRRIFWSNVDAKSGKVGLVNMNGKVEIIASVSRNAELVCEFIRRIDFDNKTDNNSEDIDLGINEDDEEDEWADGYNDDEWNNENDEIDGGDF
ncbi:MAG TPA: hypothetical protein VK610_03290 [Rhodothermales bacterium]|nr:hypothetical protein [Rhodothermales bacterium]